MFFEFIWTVSSRSIRSECIFTYIIFSSQKFIFLNEDLVNNGYAEWLVQPEAAAAAASGEALEGAVGGIEQ